jgi:mannose-6-phosphate isomerase
LLNLQKEIKDTKKMNSLYPLKFKPIFKDKIWGGEKLRTLFGKDFAPLPNCGESWELSGVEGDLSIVTNGFLKGNTLEEIIEIYMAELVGEKVFERFGLHFPILVKIIDSNQWLSIQVHPDDKLAMKRHRQNGKSEMWYVLQAEKGAQLISGFNQKVDEKKYIEYFNNGKLTEILNFENVKAGDVYNIPAGRIHALGPGVCLAEIQQTSDITYRIYDWDRLDDKGMPRELHVEQALAAIDFEFHENYKSEIKPILNTGQNLIKSPYFTTNIISFDNRYERDYYSLDSFVIYLCTEGKFTIEYEGGREKMKAGETVLIPADLNDLQLIPEKASKVLEVYME